MATSPSDPGCPFCGADLPRGRPREAPWDASGSGVPGGGPTGGERSRARWAFDPVLGRLWTLCGGCRSWIPVPLPDSGRGVEALERAFRDTGRVLLSGAGLVLASVGSEDWIRVGTPPPPEWAGWRYGSDLPRTRRRPGLMERILRTLPPPPLEGWDPYGLGRSGSLHEWVGSPFIEAAATLGRTFRRVPLAAACPGCGAPLWIEPREFERIRFLPDSGGARPMVRIRCASCDREEAVPVRSARAGIRIGLAAVDPGDEAREMAREAGRELAISGGSDAWIASLAQEEMALGEIDSVGRCALRIALDEWAEAEALREGWGRSEELSTLVHLGEGGAA